MNKLDPLSKDQQIENCLLALWLWSKVPPRRVSRDLAAWRCGTHACFGGHLATWPDFQKMGVQVGFDGSPTIADFNPGGEPALPTQVSKHLFGKESLIFCRLAASEGPESQGMSDHEVVVERLQHQIEQLSQ